MKALKEICYELFLLASILFLAVEFVLALWFLTRGPGA